MTLKYAPYNHTITLLIEGYEVEVPITVSYDVQPRELPDSTYPGCDASVTVTSIVNLALGDLLPLITANTAYKEDALEELEALILSELGDSNDRR